MLKRVIDWSVHNTLLVLLFTAVAVAAGVWSLRRVPLEALPDLSDVQVIVQTDYNEQAPRIVEDQVTYPIAAEMLKVEMESTGVDEVAKRARGTPRIALRLLRRVRDFAQVRANGVVTREIASNALDLLQVDPLGLDDVDRRVLKAIIEKYGGGPVGLNTIAAGISEEPDTIMDVVEPYLLQLGFLDRTQQGRVATKAAYEHLGFKFPDNAPQQRLL